MTPGKRAQVSSDRCPEQPETLAEEYCLGRLSPDDEQAFEAHFAVCRSCLSIITETARRVKAMTEGAWPARGTDQ